MASAERTEDLDIPLEDIYSVITDFASYPTFVTGIKAIHCSDFTENTGLSTGKVEFDVELMKRVQYTVQVKQSLDSKSGTATVHWDLLSSDLLKANSGTWTLTRSAPLKTHVNYRLEVEFKFPVPGFILKGLVANSLPTAIREFATESQKRKNGVKK